MTGWNIKKKLEKKYWILFFSLAVLFIPIVFSFNISSKNFTGISKARAQSVAVDELNKRAQAVEAAQQKLKQIQDGYTAQGIPRSQWSNKEDWVAANKAVADAQKEFNSSKGTITNPTLLDASPDNRTTRQQELEKSKTEQSWFMQQVEAAINAVMASIFLAIMGLCAWLLGLAGTIHDMAMQALVAQMGPLYKSGIGFVIERLWSMVRDLVNLTFIFGLIYAGVRMIIEAETHSAQKIIGSILISAILVNFSLFFTKALIDVSNSASTAIYNQVSSIQTPGVNGATQTGFAFAFVSTIGMESLYSTATLGQKYQNVKDIYKSEGITSIILVSIMMLVATFVLFAGAILLISRFLMLVILMIASPIYFMSGIPIAEGWKEDWKSKFIGALLFAPAYFFLLLLTILGVQSMKQLIVTSTVQQAAQKNYIAAIAGDASMMSVILFFLVGCGLMIASIVAAKHFSIIGASTVLKWGTNMRKFAFNRVRDTGRFAGRTAGSASFGLIGAGMRSSVGRMSNWAKDTNWLKNSASKGWLGKQAFKASEGLAKASFDARRIGGVGKTLGLGEGKKGGYEARVKNYQKKEEDFAKRLGTVESGEEFTAANDNVGKAEKALRDARLTREGATGEARKAAATMVLDAEKTLKDAQTALEQAKMRRQFDYTDRVGTRGMTSSWWYGGNTTISKKVAKKIRESYEKKSKMTKEEKRHAEMLEKLEAKNDNKGGHGDGHGGDGHANDNHGGGHAAPKAATPKKAAGGGGHGGGGGHN